MKYIYLLAFLIFYQIHTVNSQPYEPLVRNNAHWIVATYSYQILWLYEDFREYYTDGDTLISDTVYKKIYRYELEPINYPVYPPYLRIGDPVLYGLIREDTLARKVYGIQLNVYPGSCFSGSEDLMFDYSVSDGDSLELCNAFLGPYFIDTVYMHDIYGYNRRHFYPVIWMYSFPLIEGIGSLHGLFEPIGFTFKEFEGGGGKLMCYSIGDGSACDVITGIADIADHNLQIYPNPLQGSKLYFKLPKASGGKFEIYVADLYGRIIRQIQQNIANGEVDLGILPEGVYMIGVVKDGVTILREKIIKL